MRSLLVGLFALSALAVDVVPACAAWDNVFQPMLFGRCRKPAVSNYYAPPVVVSSSPVVSYSLPASNCTTCQSPPQQQCSTSYSQRCYYQPVTTMESRSYYESVTTQQKSYYYEPVTSYRYSSYYDPCTCGYQQVATPVTCYQLREKCCPVQSWVQRCVQVPVTTSQKVCYWQPQTTCCQTTQGAPIYGDAPLGGQQPPPQVNMVPSISQPQGPPPNVNTDRAPGNGTSPPATPMYDRFYPPQQSITQPQSYPSQSPTMPPAGTSWQPKLGAPSPFVPENRPQPSVKLDSIVVGPDSRVDGTVVRNDSSPKANAKLLFVNAGTGQRATVNANSAGRFNAELPTGTWIVYLYGADDVPTYHSQVNVANAQAARLTLVSRNN